MTTKSVKQIVNPPEFAAPAGVWSPVVVAGPCRFGFISGLTSRDAQGAVFGVGDIRAQTRRVCELLQSAVTALGTDLSAIVRVDVYVTDIEMFKDIHQVRREFFPVEPPASTMVQVSRLVDKRSLIEISAVVALPD
jgi:2-iminobutanoate/2-iminopropanoate deaminase